MLPSIPGETVEQSLLAREIPLALFASAGFLPARFQGVEFRSTGDPVLYVKNPLGVDILRSQPP